MPDEPQMSSVSISPSTTIVNLFCALLQATRSLDCTLTARADVLYKYRSFLSRAPMELAEVSPPTLRSQTGLAATKETAACMETVPNLIFSFLS